ncbi:MAG: efflux RND transporter permease subunit [Deltaproteobacteria bacterium]|nr:efflux RND transporter permease subunit [Deltaproteobacteria bacterium]
MEPTDTQKIARGPIAWMAGNSVAANLLMLVLLIGGLVMGTRIKKEVFPEFQIDSVTVTVAYPGASPEEVEKGIILSIEEAVQGLDGVDEVTSNANEGFGSVRVEMIEGEDLQRLSQEIQREVDRITSFPEDIEEPRIAVSFHKREVISLVLYGDQSEWVLRQTAEEIRDRLIQDPQITQVELGAVRPFEISIEVPQDKLRTYNLTLDQIAQRVRQSSVELPGGGVKTTSGEVLVRMKERRDYGQEFGLIPIITTNDGTQVLLEDIAVIKDDFEDNDTSATYNNKPAVMIRVYRVGDQTPVTVGDAAQKHVNALNQILPPGLNIATLKDRSQIYRQRLNLLVRNGFLGLGLVFLFLAIFLETRLAFWVSLGIPISFLGSLLFLPSMDISINMISMFAFIITLGIVVDDAIVVGENVYYYQQKGVPTLKAAIQGARDIAVPVIFSVLTNMVAFMPLLFVPGFMGKIFKQIPVVVISVFAISLVESLLILPAHLGHHKQRSRIRVMEWLHQLQQRFSGWFIQTVNGKYGPILDLTLRYRYATLSIGIAVLLITLAFAFSGRMGMILFPKVESDYAFAKATLPYGSAVEKTKAVQDLLVEAARKVTEENGGKNLVKGIFSQIGGDSGSHVAEVRIYLTDPEVRPLNTGVVTSKWREQVGAVPGLESLIFRSDSGGPGHGAGLTVELSHRDLNVLESASSELAEALGFFPNAKDIDDGFAPGKQQVDFHVTPEGRSVGLSARQVARQVRNSFYGAEALRQQRGRNEVKIMVRLPKEERVSEYDLEELILRTGSGKEIPLRQAVSAERGRAYTNIDRRSGRRTVSVTADIVPQDKTNLIIQSLKDDTLLELIKKHPGLTYTFEGKQAETRESLQSLLQGLAMAMLVIYALLAIPFKSYIQPAIIIFCIPFGIVGAVIGHIIMGYSLSVMSMFGVVALSGVVVNDSLVLIDFANKRRKTGMNAHDAIHTSGIHRFRPIFLTTLTTFGGLAPMIFETSRQARFLIPMALSLGFGVVFATFITLVLVPSLYLVVEDIYSLKK